MIEMKISESSLKVLADFRQYGRRVQGELENELDAIGLDIITAIKLKMRNTTKSSTPNSKTGHRPSVPGAPPAIDGGRLAGSFEAKRIGGSLEVGTNVKYGAYLQTGTKGGTIKVKNAKVLSNGSAFFGKSVDHPGIKARPFLEPGIEDIDFQARFAKAIARGMQK